MKLCVSVTLCLWTASLHAAVTGTVINATTGKPQAGATVGLNKLAQANGIELIDQAKSGADGTFTIATDPAGGPHLIRTAFDGVTYNHMLPPGSPTTGITLQVYNATKSPGDAKVTKHMILFEPAGGRMTINETLLLTNTGKTAWNDNSGGGTVQFFLPAGAGGKADVKATAPGGLPISVAIVKTGKPDIFAIDFPVKPGESRIDITYETTYTMGSPFAGKVPSKDDNTYLIAPNGITLAAEGLNDLGTEPRTQAHIYGLAGNTYSITLTGEQIVSQAEPAAEGETGGAPQIEQIMPRVNGKAIPILAISLGILALGFMLLYRSSTPKELAGMGQQGAAPHKPKEATNERGRR